MIRPSIFKISLGLIIIGTVWMGIISMETNKISENFHLPLTQTGEIEIELTKNDVGYYKVSIPELGDSAFSQIIDPQRNIIFDKKLETKMTINYFDIKENGIYKLKITNLNDHSLEGKLEMGQINTSELTYPGIVLITGIIFMIISAYQKLRNYNIAQPEEKIS